MMNKICFIVQQVGTDDDDYPPLPPITCVEGVEYARLVTSKDDCDENILTASNKEACCVNSFPTLPLTKKSKKVTKRTKNNSKTERYKE